MAQPPNTFFKVLLISVLSLREMLKKSVYFVKSDEIWHILSCIFRVKEKGFQVFYVRVWNSSFVTQD